MTSTHLESWAPSPWARQYHPEDRISAAATPLGNVHVWKRRSSRDPDVAPVELVGTTGRTRWGVQSMNRGTERRMAGDPRRVVEDLENKVSAEEAGLEAGDDLPTLAAEDASSVTPGVEPTD